MVCGEGRPSPLKLKLVLATALVVAAATVVVAFSSDETFQGISVKAPFDASLHGKGSRTAGNQIIYHGGPVMHPVSVYYIYYGAVSTTVQTIMNDFLIDLNVEPPYGVNETYYDKAPQPSPGPVLSGYTFTLPNGSSTGVWDNSVFRDNYSQGTQLGTSSVQRIVAHALAAGVPDPNGVYVVITSPDVTISGFCKSFCAYHNTSSTIASGYQIRYALVPDPTQKCSGCNGGIAIYQDTATPNGDMGADTMTDDLMHELSETVTDPDINAWYTKGGAEVGDLCNYVYAGSGATVSEYVEKNGNTYHYNFSNNGRRYLIQLIWKNVGAGVCAGS
jgi:hypothetical protein